MTIDEGASKQSEDVLMKLTMIARFELQTFEA